MLAFTQSAHTLAFGCASCFLLTSMIRSINEVCEYGRVCESEFVDEIHAASRFLTGAFFLVTSFFIIFAANVQAMNATQIVVPLNTADKVYDNNCPICMGSPNGRTVFVRCGHGYHRGCLDAYVATTVKCAVCKKCM